jgi:hypothetical protein
MNLKNIFQLTIIIIFITTDIIIDKLSHQFLFLSCFILIALVEILEIYLIYYRKCPNLIFSLSDKNIEKSLAVYFSRQIIVIALVSIIFFSLKYYELAFKSFTITYYIIYISILLILRFFIFNLIKNKRLVMFFVDKNILYKNELKLVKYNLDDLISIKFHLGEDGFLLEFKNWKEIILKNTEFNESEIIDFIYLIHKNKNNLILNETIREKITAANRGFVQVGQT